MSPERSKRNDARDKTLRDQGDLANRSESRAHIVKLGIDSHDFTSQRRGPAPPVGSIIRFRGGAPAHQIQGRFFFQRLSAARLFQRRQSQLDPALLIFLFALNSPPPDGLEVKVRQSMLGVTSYRRSRRRNRPLRVFEEAARSFVVGALSRRHINQG